MNWEAVGVVLAVLIAAIGAATAWQRLSLQAALRGQSGDLKSWIDVELKQMERRLRDEFQSKEVTGVLVAALTERVARLEQRVFRDDPHK